MNKNKDTGQHTGFSVSFKDPIDKNTNLGLVNNAVKYPFLESSMASEESKMVSRIDSTPEFMLENSYKRMSI